VLAMTPLPSHSHSSVEFRLLVDALLLLSLPGQLTSPDAVRLRRLLSVGNTSRDAIGKLGRRACEGTADADTDADMDAERDRGRCRVGNDKVESEGWPSLLALSSTLSSEDVRECVRAESMIVMMLWYDLWC